MAGRLEQAPNKWWERFAKRMRRSVPEASEIVRRAGQTPARFPHVQIRTVIGEPEAYVVGTGLAVWEIVWLARSYGHAASVAEQTYADAALVSEGLRYADEHHDEIAVQIRRHTQVTAEELRALLPNIKIIRDDNGTSDHTSA